MRRFAPLLGLLLTLPVAAHAQTGPNFQTGQIPTAAQWQAAFTAKADVASGTLNTPTLNGGTFNGNIGGSPTLAGIWTFSPSTVLAGVTLSNATLSGTFLGDPILAGTLTVTGGTPPNPNIIADQRLRVGTGAAISSLVLNGAMASFKGLSMQTNTLTRWQFLWTGTETGSNNTGSDILVRAVADDGTTTLADLMTLQRGLKAINFGVGGTLDISARSVPYGGFNISQGYTGSSAPTLSQGGFGQNKISINADDAALGIANTAVTFLINSNFGGSNMTGSRALMSLNHTQTAATGNVAAGNRIPFYVTLYAGHQVNTGDGGTSLLLGGVSGGGFAFNPQISALNGATNLNGITVAEVNLEARAGSSMRTKTGYQFVKTANDAVKGVGGVDTAIGVFDQAGTAVGWDYGIRIGGSGNAQWPIDQTTGTVIGVSTGSNFATTGAMTAGYGVDLLEATYANFAYRSTGFSVNGAGTMQIGAGLISGDSTGMVLNSTGAVGSGTPTISAGGTGYVPSTAVILKDRVYGAIYEGIADAGGVITSITAVRRQPVAAVNTGLPGTLTLVPWAASDGTGTIVNVVWSAGRTKLTLNPIGPLQIGSASLTLTPGAVGLTKMTASASAPGAAGGKLELVCGTNAGTAKLIMYAGTSGTAVTVVDNAGTAVTGC